MTIILAKWPNKSFTFHFLDDYFSRDDLFFSLDEVGNPEVAKVRELTEEVLEDYDFSYFEPSQKNCKGLWKLCKKL